MTKRPTTKNDPFVSRRARLKRLRAAMRKEGADALLITNANDIRYLTGFSGEDSFAVIAPRSFVVISDFRFNEQLDEITPVAKVHLRTGLMPEAVREVVSDLGIRELGFQSEYLTVAHKELYRKRLKGVKLVATKGVLDSLRVIKDDEEIASIRKAARLQQKALTQTLDEIGPGQTETAIAALLEYNMKTLGSEGTAFGTIVASGPNSAVPHALAGKRKAANGKPLLIDFGAISDGYRSDMTRVFSFGSWNPKMREIYGVVRDAHKEAARALKPGVSTADVDRAARALITDAGFGDLFGHGTGHGIGLDIHEDPRLSKTNPGVLEAGMVVTVEPGIYIQGLGGVRLEDDYVVTKTGAKNLCTLPMTIEWATR